MVAGLGTATSPQTGQGKALEVRNRILDVLISRLGSSKTFGENMIFMLNRACTFYMAYSPIVVEDVLQLDPRKISACSYSC